MAFSIALLSIVQLGVLAEEQANQAQELFNSVTQKLRIVKPYERDEEAEAKRIKSADFTGEALCEGEMFDIFSRIQLVELEKSNNSIITDGQTLTELQMITLSSALGQKGLLGQFNTSMVATDVVLAKMFALPIDDVNMLKQRQELVGVLVQDEYLVDQLNNHFRELAYVQQDVLRFYTLHDFVNNKIVSQHFFGEKLGMLNGMPWV